MSGRRPVLLAAGPAIVVLLTAAAPVSPNRYAIRCVGDMTTIAQGPDGKTITTTKPAEHLYIIDEAARSVGRWLPGPPESLEDMCVMREPDCAATFTANKITVLGTKPVTRGNISINQSFSYDRPTRRVLTIVNVALSDGTKVVLRFPLICAATELPIGS